MTPLQVAKPVVLDLAAALAFAAAFFVAKSGFHVDGLNAVYVATATGIGIGLVQLALKKAAREAIGPLQWLSLGVVVALGAMTILLRDEHFIKLKPSAIDIAVGLFMATRDWMTPYLPADVKQDIPRRTVMLVEKLWAVLMISFGLVNIAVAFLFDFQIWVVYATFVPTLIIIALFFFQYSAFRAVARRNAAARVAAAAAAE
jgi:intracellular septation protein